MADRASRAGSPQEADQLGCREPCGTAQLEPLPRALRGWQLSDRPAAGGGQGERDRLLAHVPPPRSEGGLAPCAGSRRPGPGRREPADSPRHPDPGRNAGYGAALTRRLPAPHQPLPRAHCGTAISARVMRIALNAAWSPIGAHSEPVRTNSQPRTKAIGTRTTPPTMASETASWNESPPTNRTCATHEQQGRPHDRRPRSHGPAPGRQREAPEEDLLVDRGEHRTGEEVEDEAGRRARRRQRARRRDAGELDRDHGDDGGDDDHGSANAAPPASPRTLAKARLEAHLAPGEHARTDDRQPKHAQEHDGQDDDAEQVAERGRGIAPATWSSGMPTR